MARDLTDKVIVIAGGSSGIGAATAEHCAKAGMHVVLGARREDKLRAIAERVEAHGRRALCVRCDVNSGEDVQNLFDQAWDTFGRIDAAFANAGYGLASGVLDTTDDEHRAIFETNYFGTLRVVRSSVPYLRRTENGLRHLLICSSVVSEIGVPWYGAYSATKAAQDCIAGALRSELQDDIEVTSVHPSGTRTEFFDTAEKKAGGAGSGEINAPKMFTQTPGQVARKIVAALRRPRAEVWPLGIVRFALGFATMFPGLTNFALKRGSRGQDPRLARQPSPPAPDSQAPP